MAFSLDIAKILLGKACYVLLIEFMSSLVNMQLETAALIRQSYVVDVAVYIFFPWDTYHFSDV